MKMRYLLAVLLCIAAPLRAQDVAGEFDYYVMALSWSPNWCALEGDARDSPQCGDERDFGWILHGLWPQHETGWPQDCDSPHTPPSRAMTRDMADMMGTSGLAWYQWNKHGACSGLSPADYFDLASLAYDRVVRPEAFRRLPDPVRLPAALIEEAFIADNPDISPDGITVTCRDGYIQEARICLSRDLEFRDCGADVVRDCTLDDAVFKPVR